MLLAQSEIVPTVAEPVEGPAAQEASVPAAPNSVDAERGGSCQPRFINSLQTRILGVIHSLSRPPIVGATKRPRKPTGRGRSIGGLSAGRVEGEYNVVEVWPYFSAPGLSALRWRCLS